MINENDGPFKQLLDRYKYPGRYPTASPELGAAHYRDEAGVSLRRLNARLATRPLLMGEAMSLPDAAIFPFVRQFASVDKIWFDTTYAGPLTAWLNTLVTSPLFLGVMKKQSGATQIAMATAAN